MSLGSSLVVAAGRRQRERKKADVVEHRKAFDHVGLLGNKPLGACRDALYLVIRYFYYIFPN